MTTPSTSAQGPVAGWKLVPTVPTLDMQKAYFDEIDRNMHRVETDCTFGRFDNHRVAYAAMLTASPSPAASPASPSGVLDLYREAVRVDVKMEGPQFMGCNTSALKRAWEADRASLASDATPAPTSGSEDGGETKGWAAVYDGQIKSCHRSRETCIADAENYQAIHPVYLGPAWRHQED